MFEVERFIEDCQRAAAEGESSKAVREVVARAVGEPAKLIAALGEPTEAGVNKLYQSDGMTILHLVWAPHMTISPHDHRMWAVIGIYGGGEDNIFWRRTPGGIEATGAQALRQGDVAPLGKDIVHSVINPTEKFTGSIHVYGGDFFSMPRSEWDPETLSETPYDVEKTIQLFAQANAQYEAGRQVVH